jgi:hypothetical protein
MVRMFQQWRGDISVAQVGRDEMLDAVETCRGLFEKGVVGVGAGEVVGLSLLSKQQDTVATRRMQMTESAVRAVWEQYRRRLRARRAC